MDLNEKIAAVIADIAARAREGAATVSLAQAERETALDLQAEARRERRGW